MRQLVFGLVMALLLVASPAASGGVGPFAYLSNTGGSSVLAVDTANPSNPAYVMVGKPTYGVAVDPKGARAYVTDFSIQGKLYAIDTTTNPPHLIGGGGVPVGKMPYGVAVKGSRVYVANVLSNTVSVVDPTLIGTSINPVVDTLPAGTFPWGIVLSADGGQVYVSNVFGGLVTAIDPVTKTTRKLASDGGKPSGIAMSPDGRLYVTDYSGNRVWVVDTAKIGSAGAIINRLSVGPQPYAVAVNRDGTRVFVTNSESTTVSVIDASRGAGLEFVMPGPDPLKKNETITVGSRPHGVAMTSDGARMYVVNNGGQSLSVIDIATNVVTAVVPLPNQTFPIGFGNFLAAINRLKVRIHVVPSVVNMKGQGTVPVMIYGSKDSKDWDDFDVHALSFPDLLTIRLNGWPVKVKGNGEPMVNYGDFDGDGLDDAMVHVEKAGHQIAGVGVSGVEGCGAMLSGMIGGSNGTEFQGCDNNVRFQ